MHISVLLHMLQLVFLRNIEFDSGDPYQDQKKNQFRTGGKPKGGAEHDRSFKPSGPQPQKYFVFSF